MKLSKKFVYMNWLSVLGGCENNYQHGMLILTCCEIGGKQYFAYFCLHLLCNFKFMDEQVADYSVKI